MGNTLLGIIVGTLALVIAFWADGGSLDALFMWPAILIVLVGTLAATWAGSSGRRFARVPSLIGKALKGGEKDKDSKIRLHIYKLSEVFHKNGPLEMEKYLARQKEEEIHPYLRKLVLAVVDGSDEEDLKRLSSYEEERIEQELGQDTEIFSKMGGFSPTMGIIGTVMGLIATMAAAGESPTELIRHIATAFIATLWGIFLANLVFIPIADRLEGIHLNEMRTISLIRQGVLAIARGDSPVKVRTLMGGRDISINHNAAVRA